MLASSGFGEVVGHDLMWDIGCEATNRQISFPCTLITYLDPCGPFEIYSPLPLSSFLNNLPQPMWAIPDETYLAPTSTASLTLRFILPVTVQDYQPPTYTNIDIFA